MTTDAAAQAGFEAGRRSREEGDDPAEQVYKAVLAALAADDPVMRDLERRVRAYHRAFPSGSPIADAYGHVLWMMRQYDDGCQGADRLNCPRCTPESTVTPP